MASSSFYIMEFFFYQWKSQTFCVKGFTTEFSPFKYNLGLTLFWDKVWTEWHPSVFWSLTLKDYTGP